MKRARFFFVAFCMMCMTSLQAAQYHVTTATEQVLIAENFQGWTAVSATASLSTVGGITYYGDSIDFNLYNVAVMPTYTAKNTNGVTSIGAIQTQKTDPASSYFIATGFASVTKAVFKHSYTGGTRGCTISCKGDGDADWVTLFSANTTAAAGQIDTLSVNRTNVSLRFQGNTSSQNAYLHDLIVYGMTNEVVPVLKSINYANGDIIPYGGGNIVLVFSEKITRGTAAITLGGIAIPDSNITIQDSVVTINYDSLETDMSYSFIVLPNAFLNLEGTGNQATLSYTFKTLDTILPTLSKISIASGATMSVNGFISLVMSESCKAGSATISLGEKNLTAAISSSNNYLVYLNYSGLEYDMDYTVTIPENAIVDLTGNSYAGTTVTFHTGVEASGDTLIQFTPTATTVPSSSSDNVKIAVTATPGDSLIFGTVLSAGSRSSSSYTYAFKCNYVELPKLPSVGEFSMYVQCGGGTAPQQYFIQKQSNDSLKTWNTIETFIIGNNDAATFRSAAAQSSDSTKLRLMYDGTNLWFYTINVYAYEEVIVPDDGIDPYIISSTPTDSATGVTINGSIKFTYHESIVTGAGSILLNDKTLTPNIVGKTVTLPYANLKYATTYTLIIPVGVFLDKYGHANVADTLLFTTKNKPAVTAKLFDFVVAKDGTGNGTTIQSAFDAVPTNNASMFLIFVKNGTYDERPTLAETKPNVSLIGQNRDSVIITSDKRSGVDGYTTSTCQTVEIFADNFYCENITMKNTAGVNAGQAVALKVYADKAVFKNVKLTGYQDTHLTSNTGSDRQYYLNCQIHGTVDFIFGNGVCFFDDCGIYLEDRSNGDVICAPSTATGNDYGYVFSQCTVDGASGQDGIFNLGRPWQNSPRVVYINTTFNIIPAEVGWINMSTIPALFAEYGSVNSAHAALDVSKRNTFFSYVNSSTGDTITGSSPTAVLTENEAAAYTMANVLGGADSWAADSKTETTASPANLRINSSNLIWDSVDGAVCYIILKDSAVCSFSTTDSVTMTEGLHIYQIIAVSESGSLSEMESLTVNYIKDGLNNQAYAVPSLTRTVISSDIEFSHPEAIISVEVYNINGMRMATAGAQPSSVSVATLKPGLYLVNIKLSDESYIKTKVVKR